MPDRPDPRERFVSSVLAVVLLATFATALGPRLAHASTGRVYDPNNSPRAKYVPPMAPWPAPSYRAKDFTIVKKGGLYHLFYTRVQRFVYRHYKTATREVLNETTFGHATSPDLEHWTEADSVLRIRPWTWDAHHLWAPTYVEINGLSYLFYTGVKDTQWTSDPADWGPRRQLIGYAASLDPNLTNWIQLTNPVWGPCGTGGLPGVSWALCLPTVPRGTADFRDPFVLAPAPGSGDPAYLLYTARVRTDQHNYVAGLARASSVSAPFIDQGALWDTYYPPVNSKVESPHVFRRGDDFHLFFSGDNGSTGIAWHTAQSIHGPWTRRQPISTFLAGQLDTPHSFTLDPWAWFASEYFTADYPSGRAEYLAVVHAYEAPTGYNPPPPGMTEDVSTIEFRQMLWQPDGLFRLVAPNPVREIWWSRSNASVGDRVEMRLTVEGGSDRIVDLEYAMRYAGVETIVPAAAIGMPASRMLTNGTMVLAWTARTPIANAPVEWICRVVSQPFRAEGRMTVGPVRGGSADLVDEAPPYIKGPVGRNSLDPGESGKTSGTTGGGTADDAADDVADDAADDPATASSLAEPRTFDLSAVRAAGPAGTHELALTFEAAGRARLDVFDVLGRRVRALGERVYPAGTTIERWDGRNDAGQAVARGIYFVRATAPFGARTARLLVVD